MQFTRVVGDIDPAIIAAAEKKLTDVFLELGASTNNTGYVSKLGGDPLIFALIVPTQHIATLNIPTAGTNGRCIWWNPNFIISKNSLGIRFTCYHESAHALLMHPQRRGNRDWRLWNIAVDYIANGWIMEDLLIRVARSSKDKRQLTPEKAKLQMHELFVKGFGNYCTIKQCQQMFSNPLGPVDGMENWTPELPDPNKVALPAPDSEKALTDAEKKTLAKEELKFKLYYADPNLTEEMKRPEKIYDLLYQATPKCPECGKLGIYVPPQSATKKPTPTKEKQKDNEASNSKPNHQHSNDQSHNHQHSDSGGSGNSNSGKDNPGNGAPTSSGDGDDGTLGNQGKGCKTCPTGYDVLDFGSEVDTHMDSVEDPDELTKRVSDAIQTAKAMAGTIPGSITSELDKLSAPRISFPDVIRSQLAKARNGNSRNDWTRFRNRPLSLGLLVPKKKGNVAKFACLLDTSCSMKADDRALCISQLQALDDRAEGVVVFCDVKCHWDKVVQLKKCDTATLQQLKPFGDGGTYISKFFTEYEKNVGKMDFLIVLSDGMYSTHDLDHMIDPKIPVFWLLSNNGVDFKAPFGRVFSLRD